MVLPHNSYHVSLDGSRRVTQRTRAHIKPISLFPIRVDAFYVPQPLRVTSYALRARSQHDVAVPVTAQDYAIEEKAALEPAAQTKDANEDVLEVKCPVDRPALVTKSASPLLHRR